MDKKFIYAELKTVAAALAVEAEALAAAAPAYFPPELVHRILDTMVLMRLAGYDPDEKHARYFLKRINDYTRKASDAALERVVETQRPRIGEWGDKNDAELPEVSAAVDYADPPSKRATACGLTPTLPDNAPAPRPINPDSGQHGDYWVLSEEERRKGFVRPVRLSYVHVGKAAPLTPLQDLTDKQKETYGDHFAKYEPNGGRNGSGRFWTQEEIEKINSGCGSMTKMNQKIAETYAVNPKYYGSTFCFRCGVHLPVEEFIWEGTTERVGT